MEKNIFSKKKSIIGLRQLFCVKKILNNEIYYLKSGLHL
jgi:hypothetical protein